MNGSGARAPRERKMGPDSRSTRSSSQVSEYTIWPVPVKFWSHPPNRSAIPAPGSTANAASSRGAGAKALVTLVHAGVWNEKIQVELVTRSFARSVSPPNSTAVPAVGSEANPKSLRAEGEGDTESGAHRSRDSL